MPEPFDTLRTPPEPIQRQREALRTFRRADRDCREAEIAARKQHEQAKLAADASVRKAHQVLAEQRTLSLDEIAAHRRITEEDAKIGFDQDLRNLDAEFGEIDWLRKSVRDLLVHMGPSVDMEFLSFPDTYPSEADLLRVESSNWNEDSKDAAIAIQEKVAEYQRAQLRWRGYIIFWVSLLLITLTVYTYWLQSQWGIVIGLSMIFIIVSIVWWVNATNALELFLRDSECEECGSEFSSSLSEKGWVWANLC